VTPVTLPCDLWSCNTQDRQIEGKINLVSLSPILSAHYSSYST
jgi:hypothetical protein